MVNGPRVRIKCTDGTGYLYGTVTGERLEKILVSLDEYKAADYEFEREKLEIIPDETAELKTGD